MPQLYIDDETWAPKAREALGWVKYHQDHNIYDQSGIDIDFQLPYFPHEPWLDIAKQFDIALELSQPQAGEWVLDLGAGRGWAAKHFALRGCQAVAIDIVSDDQVGLGRSRALMQAAGVTYDTLIADSEQLPFADRSFDLVFCAAALHHTTDLARLLKNIGRVLRPGGRMIAINEPCVPDQSDDEELRQTVLAEELSYGINETRPRLADYRRVLRAAGLHEQLLVTPETYQSTLENMTAWSLELRISSPSAFIQPEPHLPTKVWRILGRRKPMPPYRSQLPQGWIDHLLRERGAAMILLATK
ncbi:MAG: class I SAM-dependent methyltransferase [Herpetosiphonaceae bacterium]|nr:class I SAM-dependent methyltransferase [Herpetosiphonaceae bacterium]